MSIHVSFFIVFFYNKNEYKITSKTHLENSFVGNNSKS